jgi:4-amino-4-deoxy-L-arabinose transferase-like glycosyltransferase
VARHLSIILVVSALTLLAGLGRPAITDSDEAFYAEAAREMVVSGDWLTPRYNFDERFQKPILYYWLAAGLFRLVGVSESAARLPSALSGVLMALLTYLCGRRWLGARAAFAGALVVATSFGTFAMARLALPDLPLACFITAAIWSLAEAQFAPETPSSTVRAWLLLAATALALAFLTKGPVGVAIPVLVWLCLLPIGDPRRRFRLPGGPADWLLAAIVFAAISVPWYVAMASRHGFDYVYRFFVAENLDRFATTRYNEPRSVFFYVPIVLGGLLPWSPVMALWVGTLRRVIARVRPVDTREWALLAWAGAPLVFYSLSIGKQPRYILPALPPLALMLGATIARRVERMTAEERDAGLARCTAATALVLAGVVFLFARLRPALVTLPAAVAAMAVALLVIAAAVALGPARWLPQRWTVACVAAASTTTLLVLQFTVYSMAGPEPVQAIARHLVSDAPAARSGTYRVFVRNLIFYTGRRQEDLTTEEEAVAFLARAERVHCVLAAETLPAIERRLGRSLQPVAELPYFNVARLRLGALLHPRAQLPLERVLLVANH